MIPKLATPTPVERLTHVSDAAGCDVWVKRDDLANATYGGNKARKLVPILGSAHLADVTDLITLGPAGSNHVLATAIHGAASGFAVHAVLVPQPDSASARTTLTASIAHGAKLVAVERELAVPTTLAKIALRIRRAGGKPFFIPPGGTSRIGVSSYIEAFDELAAQVALQEVPAWPDAIFCALGSGGTHAGLAAGCLRLGNPCRVIGVKVRDGWAVTRTAVSLLGRKALRHLDHNGARLSRSDVEIVDNQGDGYGIASEAGEHARELFSRDGITLDSSYTAKAAAAMLVEARDKGLQRVLLWHTYSSPPPSSAQIPDELEALLR
jgi:D-cysteine desulfhydrase